MTYPEGATHCKKFDGEILYFKFVKSHHQYGKRVEDYQMWMPLSQKWERLPVEFKEANCVRFPVPLIQE